MEKKWSDELVAYTRDHFGDLRATCLKNINGGYAVAYDSSLFIPDRVKASVPEAEKGKRFILSEHKTGAFVAAYDSLEDLIDAGWALD